MRANALSLFAVALIGSSLATGCGGQIGDDGMSEAALSNSEQSAFNFFVSKGLTKIQSAGVIGNLMQESSVNPAAVEYGGGPGRGIAQWSVGGRWDTSRNDNVTAYASARGENRWALGTQLNFTWYELETLAATDCRSCAPRAPSRRRRSPFKIASKAAAPATSRSASSTPSRR